MAKARAKDPDDMTYEQAFGELQEIVVRLESGELALEKAMALFERGQALSDRCTRLLEDAELRLRQLAPDDDEGFRETDLELDEA